MLGPIFTHCIVEKGCPLLEPMFNIPSSFLRLKFAQNPMLGRVKLAKRRKLFIFTVLHSISDRKISLVY